MYVTGLGGAKPSQANAGDCSAAVETHCFTSHAPLIKGESFCITQTHTHTATLWPRLWDWDHRGEINIAAMVKCLIRITTRVNVHLRMINHCYRDVKVRVLSLGPRMLGKALGVLPLYPALTGLQESASTTPLPGTPLPCVQPNGPPGKVIPEPAMGVLYLKVQMVLSLSNQSSATSTFAGRKEHFCGCLCVLELSVTRQACLIFARDFFVVCILLVWTGCLCVADVFAFNLYTVFQGGCQNYVVGFKMAKLETL